MKEPEVWTVVEAAHADDPERKRYIRHGHWWVWFGDDGEWRYTLWDRLTEPRVLRWGIDA